MVTRIMCGQELLWCHQLVFLPPGPYSRQQSRRWLTNILCQRMPSIPPSPYSHQQPRRWLTNILCQRMSGIQPSRGFNCHYPLDFRVYLTQLPSSLTKRLFMKTIHHVSQKSHRNTVDPMTIVFARVHAVSQSWTMAYLETLVRAHECRPFSLSLILIFVVPGHVAPERPHHEFAHFIPCKTSTPIASRKRKALPDPAAAVSPRDFGKST
jgi:hypothetical protein